MAAPTKTFTLSPSISTLLSAAIPNPGGRLYVLIQNLDLVNFIAWAYGTNNGATGLHHLIPHGSYYEFRFKPVTGGFPFPEKMWGLTSDIAAISVSGNPSIAYTEA